MEGLSKEGADKVTDGTAGSAAVGGGEETVIDTEGREGELLGTVARLSVPEIVLRVSGRTVTLGEV